MGKYIMALDQGTTSSRCILFDKKGNMCSVAQKEYKQYYPKPGWVEHDPKEIWSSQISVATEAMSKISVDERIFTLSESRISERLRLCGIRRQESRFIRQLYGSVAEQLI